MTWFSSVFSTPAKKSLKPGTLPTIRIDLVGREHAGKTCFLDQLQRVLGRATFASGLSFSFGDPRLLAVDLRENRENDRRLRQEGRVTTLQPRTISCSALHSGKPQLAIRIKDAIGQLLTHSTAEGSDDQRTRYERWLNGIAASDVLWAFLPAPPRNAGPSDLQRIRDDFVLHKAYVQEALKRRESQRPVVVAFLVNRIDARYADVDDARRRLPVEILTPLAVQLRPLRDDPRISSLACVPLSAFGFGCAREAPRRGVLPLTCGEREWLLKPDKTPRPYNLLGLVGWSLAAALRQQEIEQTTNVEHITELCRRLQNDFERLGAWHVPLKDE